MPFRGAHYVRGCKGSPHGEPGKGSMVTMNPST